MQIYKKTIFYLLIGIIAAFIMMPKKHILPPQIPIHIDGKTYELYHSPTKVHIDHKGIVYSLLPEQGSQFIDLCVGDVDSDCREDLLVLQGDKGSRYGNELLIYEVVVEADEIKFQEKYSNPIGKIRPWKIETCEIDQDGELEIFIGVNKATHYYTEVENRPFFFNFKDGMLVKKWTGSKVRAPFTDVCFGDLTGNGRDEFIVIEQTNEGQYVVAVYYWFGFGFVLQGESLAYDAIDSIAVMDSDQSSYIEVKVKEGSKQKRMDLRISKERTPNAIYLLKERDEGE